jgi:hypothetical protein
MTITRVAHGTVSKVNSGNLSPGAPAGSASGDCWLCYVTAASGTQPTLSMSGDWTPEYHVGIGAGWRGACFSHPYTGTAPSLTVTNDGVSAAIAVIVAYGSDVGDVAVDVVGTDPSSGTTIDYPTAAPAGANEMCVFAWHTAGSGTNEAVSGTDPTPTERLDDEHTFTLEVGLGYADGIRTADTATGARTSTYSKSTDNLGSTVLLKVAAPPVPPDPLYFAPVRRR